MGLHTDASHRFERGADFESTVLSCDLVAALILESGGGELVGDVVDVVSRQIDLAPVVLRVSEVRRILGGNLEPGEIFRILKKLGFTVIPEGQADAQFRVHIPSWRLDVEREIDVIEEIARLHGYDKFENTLPAYSGAVVELPHAAMDATLRGRALALGYNEAVSLTFISHADAEKFSSAAVLELENPLSEEASVMRTSMAPGMLDMLAWNLNRDSENVRLFEMGRVYEMRGGERVEPARCVPGGDFGGGEGIAPGGWGAGCQQGRTGCRGGGVSLVQRRCGESAGAVCLSRVEFRSGDGGVFSSGTIGAGADGWGRGGAVRADCREREGGAEVAAGCFSGGDRSGATARASDCGRFASRRWGNIRRWNGIFRLCLGMKWSLRRCGGR